MMNYGFNKIYVRILVLTLLLGFGSGCAVQKRKSHRLNYKTKIPSVQVKRHQAPVLYDTVPVQSKIEKTTGEPKAQVSSNEPVIKITYNKSIEKWIDYFSIKDRKRFQRFLNRGEKYRPYIEAVLAENELPQELYYLAMIESGFVPHAKSRASAVGVWQFMKGTAGDYGLEVNRYIDERKDYLQATEAAASFIRDLYNSLGSWELAIAAYNCGEARVRRTVRKARTRNFWTLAKYKRLPAETRNYVPKFMAATIIGKNPTKFGFKAPQSKKSVALSLVKVPGGISLNNVSQIAGLSLKSLKQHNLHLRSGRTPANKRSYKIWIPKHKAHVVKTSYNRLAKYRSKVRSSWKQRRVASKSKSHRVRAGENLGLIASKYKVSVSYLKRINGFSHARIFPGQKILISSPQVSKSRVHIVRRGESLFRIAQKYGRSVAGLKQLNGLRNTKIFVGQKIKLHSESYAPKAIYHRVKKGENLNHIAKLYAAHVKSIKKTNRLRGSRILVGQKLKIPVSSLKTYKVKSGDSLLKIAQNFGVKIQSLRSANNLKSSKIYVGQVLNIIK